MGQREVYESLGTTKGRHACPVIKHRHQVQRLLPWLLRTSTRLSWQFKRKSEHSWSCSYFCRDPQRWKCGGSASSVLLLHSPSQAASVHQFFHANCVDRAYCCAASASGIYKAYGVLCCVLFPPHLFAMEWQRSVQETSVFETRTYSRCLFSICV